MMGWQSELLIDTDVKDGCLKNIRGILTEIKLKISARIAENWEGELDLLTVDDDGIFGIEGGDWFLRWREDEIWVQKLAPFLNDGDIEFTGEDGGKYGYRIIDGITYVLYFHWARTLGEPLNKENKEIK